jgi:hypothetical protein
MAGKMDRLSAPLGKLLKACGLGSGLHEYRIFGQWEKSVGAVIARHAQPQSLRGKKLTLIVDSPAWMQQLSLLKPEIVEKVNHHLGKGVVKDITLKLGEVEFRGQPVEEPPVLNVLDRDDREKIETYVRGIGDADTREAIRRVIEKDFLNKKNVRKK